MRSTIPASLIALVLVASVAQAEPDYSKRAAPVTAELRALLIGKWTNPVDDLIVDIRSVDPTTGELRGMEWPSTALRSDSSAPGTEHVITGWVSAAPVRQGLDNVTPVTLTASLHEYGTLPVWAGYIKDGKLITMHYLVWPARTYPWDHVSAFQETWTKLDSGGTR
jgi:hypothetical protein